VDGLSATKSEGAGLSVRTISFQDFQLMWSWSTNVTDRRTDRRTTCNLNTALCTSAWRGKKKRWQVLRGWSYISWLYCVSRWLYVAPYLLGFPRNRNSSSLSLYKTSG